MKARSYGTVVWSDEIDLALITFMNVLLRFKELKNG